MGEIKSTLDLIMERTKNLSMSSEEKEEVRRQDWLKKARGWIQKFLDDQIELDKIKGQVLSQAPPEGWEKMLKGELINGLEPGGDNERRYLLLKTLLNLPPAPYEALLEAFTHKVDQEKDRYRKEQKKHWAGQEISGSALVPNQDRNPAWKQFFEQARQDCKEKIAGL
jgi:hypothetical protein